jgi:uncharacterized membrane protein YeaQ/YmgE (transglycosylase-associated protein family)
MGVVACLLFGVMAAWIARSIQGKSAAGSGFGILITGIVGGVAGLSGILIGWGNLEDFNLFNVFLSIIIASAITVIWTKVQDFAHPVKHAAEAIEEV